MHMVIHLTHPMHGLNAHRKRAGLYAFTVVVVVYTWQMIRNERLNCDSASAASFAVVVQDSGLGRSDTTPGHLHRSSSRGISTSRVFSPGTSALYYHYTSSCFVFARIQHRLRSPLPLYSKSVPLETYTRNDCPQVIRSARLCRRKKARGGPGG